MDADLRSDDAPLPGDVSQTPLPERVIPYWRITNALGSIPLFAVGLSAAFSIPGVPLVIRLLIVLATAVASAANVVVVPPVRHRTWWYAIDDEQIDLQRGIITVERVVVPMTRVQHVELQQGPLARRFRLAGLRVHTAAGVVTIPAMDAAEGERIRQRIADLARIADDL